VADLNETDQNLVDRVQRLERLAWKSVTLAAQVWERFTNLERCTYIEERIRTLAFLEATPAKR